nr:hypothetical protein I308_02090 [Cryptococcus tetragattii IND107]
MRRRRFGKLRFVPPQFYLAPLRLPLPLRLRPPHHVPPHLHPRIQRIRIRCTLPPARHTKTTHLRGLPWPCIRRDRFRHGGCRSIPLGQQTD